MVDYLSLRKVVDIKAVIGRAGTALRYLPRYGPELNLLEEIFAKLKELLRKTQARTLN